MKLQLTEQEIYALKQLIEQNDKIETIKYIRDLTGMGLKESKELSDRFFEMPSEIDHLLYDPKVEEAAIEETVIEDITIEETQHEHKNQSYELSADELKFVEMLLKKGKKLNAIKYVKEHLNLGLKEAKELVEFMDIDNPYSSRTETGFLDRDQTDLNESKINNDLNDELNTFVLNESKIAAKKKLLESEKQPEYESEAIVFQKSISRDKNKGKRRRQSNSGCMLMLTFMFIGGLIIVGGIYFL